MKNEIKTKVKCSYCGENDAEYYFLESNEPICDDCKDELVDDLFEEIIGEDED